MSRDMEESLLNKIETLIEEINQLTEENEHLKSVNSTYRKRLNVVFNSKREELLKENKELKEQISQLEFDDKLKCELYEKVILENEILKSGIATLRSLTGFEIERNPVAFRSPVIPRALRNGKENNLTIMDAIWEDMRQYQYLLNIYWAYDKKAMTKEMSKDFYERLEKMLEVIENE